MKKIICTIVLIGAIFFMIAPAEGDVCKVKCRTEEGIICIERGPCEPINEFLLRAARHCRETTPALSTTISKLLFVDILSRVIRLDKEFPQDIAKLNDEARYDLEVKLLSEKGMDIFTGTNPFAPLTREELVDILKDAPVEKDLGYSNGLANQTFELENDEFIIYHATVYIDEGSGFEVWERKEDLGESLPDTKHYSIKVDTCNNAMVVFGDDVNGKIPVVGSRMKTLYHLYGKDDDNVSECEVVALLSNSTIARSIKAAYNPSRPLTKENFADLLIKAMHLERELPRDFTQLSTEELYGLQAKILSRHGIDIFRGSDYNTLLSREELARILYNSPIEEIIGISDGKESQNFELNNAGFMIYDLHTYINEGVRYVEWNKRDSFIESGSESKDYILKLDAANYASIYFGNGKNAKVPSVNAPIKVRYRLYAPSTMITEDDIICVLGKLKPVAEAYRLPTPPFEFPDPPDGYDDPATHI
ncbi:MAG: hypothetical protein KJ957_03410 [Candidatus Omnitrophica bacterium]|nr:hypothetical protein [Candidatus Omnitrophota bacterium]MBU1853076.1 hypothetical protein [Candidatus Omnitrophota bacterium]